MKPLERLFEREGLPAFGLPAALAAIYGGDFGVPRPVLYANFVSSIDGVVALATDAESGKLISGGNEADRFVMGLLRAVADAVLVGAGTFRKVTRALWHADSIYPPAGELFADLRRKLGLRPHPLLVVVTASGEIDRRHPALEDALIITTPTGEERLRGALPAGARIVVAEAQHIRGRALLDRLRAEGLQAILTEGGPSLAGELFREGLVDELFLTVSPRLFGREAGDGRKSLVDGADLTTAVAGQLTGTSLALAGLRRHESYLFLRYTR
jgi:riboflavin biosynthesis pyrimidine reductase